LTLKDLRKLTLRKTRISGRGLELLARGLPNLEELDLANCQLTDGELGVFPMFKSLKSVILSGNFAMTDMGLRNLQPCKTLEGLDVSRTNITDKAINESNLPDKLKFLNVKNCPHITITALRTMKKNCPNLEISSTLKDR